jgi:hypothetical protein
VARTRITIDQKAIDRYFRSDPVAQAGLRTVAEEYKEMAIAATPIGRSTGKFFSQGKGPSRRVYGPYSGPGPRGAPPGPYRHGFAKRGAYHVRPFRGGFRVYTRERFAHIIEYGSAFSPVYSPMRRALRAIRAGRVVINPGKSSGDT